MTKTLRSVAANPSPDRWGRCWLLALGGWVVAAGLSGCAGGAEAATRPAVFHALGSGRKTIAPCSTTA